MTYGQPFGIATTAAAAAAMAGSAATPMQTRKAQKQAFSLATNASKLVGPQVASARSIVGTAVSKVTKGVEELDSAIVLTRDAHNQFANSMTVGLGLLITSLGYIWGKNTSRIVGAGNILASAYTLLTEYNSTVRSISTQVGRIQGNLDRVPFRYRSGYSGSTAVYEVKNCADLRIFKGQADIAKSTLGNIYVSLHAIREEIYFYGRTEGKQRRNQTKQLLTEAKLAANDMMSFLTSLARSGSAVRWIRRYVDMQNEDSCTAGNRTTYTGGDPRDSSSYRRMTDSEKAANCHGLNALGAIFMLVAAKQGRSWTNYRLRWDSLSNSDKERNIVTGLTLLREDVFKPLRNRVIPNAREQFVDLFKGMGDVIGKLRTNFTSSQYNALGPVAQGTLALTDLMNQVRQADASSNALAFPLAVMGDLSPIKCQAGSGYAGIFSGDDGEPVDPLMLLGGGLVVGLAAAHFLRR